MTDRLFVPLKTEHYRNFEAGTKDVELRGYDLTENDEGELVPSGQFSPENVYPGRPAELRRGYSTPDSLFGTVGKTWTTNMLTQIPIMLDYNRILPGASHTEFLHSAAELLTGYDRYIAFGVVLDG